jgi:hypothetical protein
MSELRRDMIDMPWWLVEKVAAELDANGMRVRWLHEMGEPLLYERLAEAIDLFPGASVSTNAMLLDEARGRQLLASSLGRIRLCLDTVSPRLYPLIRRGGRFERVLANVRRFLELSRGHPIRVEVQRMITTRTAHETVRDFHELLGLSRYPQATVIEKTCEGLDTADATDLHDAYHGCFQGYPFRWFIVLADGRVTHCCYDAHGEQPIGDLRAQTVQEILASSALETFMRAFQERDFETLPRCGECLRETSGRSAVSGSLVRLAHRLDRVLPVKQVARRIINR